MNLYSGTLYPLSAVSCSPSRRKSFGKLQSINVNLFNAQPSYYPLKTQKTKHSSESVIEEFQVARPGWYQLGSAFETSSQGRPLIF